MEHLLTARDFQRDVGKQLNDQYLDRCDDRYKWLLRYFRIEYADRPVDDDGVDVLSPEVKEYLISWTAVQVLRDNLSVTLRETRLGTIDEDPYRSRFFAYERSMKENFAILTRNGVLGSFPGAHNTAILYTS